MALQHRVRMPWPICSWGRRPSPMRTGSNQRYAEPHQLRIDAAHIMHRKGCSTAPRALLPLTVSIWCSGSLSGGLTLAVRASATSHWVSSKHHAYTRERYPLISSLQSPGVNFRIEGISAFLR